MGSQHEEPDGQGSPMVRRPTEIVQLKQSGSLLTTSEMAKEESEKGGAVGSSTQGRRHKLQVLCH